MRRIGLRRCSTKNKRKNETKSDGEETNCTKLLTHNEGQITKILMYVISSMWKAPFQSHKP